MDYAAAQRTGGGIMVWVCKKCGDNKIGRAIEGMQYINDDYFNEILKTGNWDCRFCGETEIEEE